MPQYFANGKVKSISKKENNTTIIISTCILCKKKIIKTKIQVVYSERGLESCWLHNIFAVFVLLSIWILVLSRQQGQILDKDIYFEFVYMNVQS